MDSDNSKNTSTSPTLECHDDEIDLRNLILVLWNYRKHSRDFFASVLIGVVISFAITSVYRSRPRYRCNYCRSRQRKQLMTPETAREILPSSDFQEQAWDLGISAGHSILPLLKIRIFCSSP